MYIEFMQKCMYVYILIFSRRHLWLRISSRGAELIWEADIDIVQIFCIGGSY